MNGLRVHVGAPINRNAYALVLNTLITSGLGVVFWLIAARRYSESEVGLNAALVSAMLLIASLAHLGMKNGLIRFVPDRGANTSALIKGAYALGILVAAGAALVLVLGLRSLVPELAGIGPASTVVVWFTAASVAWVIFQLQDSVLIGFRRAAWVLAENTAFSIVKIVLLLALASGGIRLGIFASWTLPLVGFVLIVNVLVFRRLIPAAEPRAAVRLVRARDVAHLAGGDYLASLFWDAALLGLPLVVLARAGAEANAHYYLAWSMAYVLYIVVSNVAQSLVVEAVRDRHRLGELTRRGLALAAGLVVTLATLLVLLGPLLLRIFGESYSEAGSSALRLLALSALPYTLTGIYLGVARVERRVKAILSVYGALSVTVLGLSFIWLGPYGITGVGLAWLAGQTAVATFLLVKGFWKLWLPLLGLPVPHTLLEWRRIRRQRVSHSEAMDLASRLALENQEVHWARTSHEIVIAAIGDAGVVKHAQSARAERSLEANHRALLELRADPRIGEWIDLVPEVTSTGRADGKLYVVESRLEGIPAADLLAGHREVISGATRAIADLHQSTSTSVIADAERLAAWLTQPFEVLEAAVDDHGRTQLEHLRTLFDRSLGGRVVQAGWVHGDFTPGNVLMSPDGGRVTGVVDWSLSNPVHLPEIDLWLFDLSSRVLEQRRELGDVVVELLTRDRPSKSHPNEDLPWRPLLLLCWLHHVAGNLTKSPYYARNRLWLSRNVKSVLLAIGDLALPEVSIRMGAPPC